MRKDYLKFMASVQKGLKDKIKKMVKMLSHHHIKYFLLIKKCIYLSYAKKRTCLSFFLLKIFEFYFCPDNYESTVSKSASNSYCLINKTFASISQIVEKLNTNLVLYNKLKQAHSLAINNETSNMDECDKRVCNLFLNDFEQSGIHLDQTTRNKFVNVNDQLLDYMAQFQASTQAPTQISFKDIEQKFIQLYVLFF